MTTKKTVIALAASVGLGLLPLALVGLTGCGDNPTVVNPFDAGSDARPDTGADGAADSGGNKDGSGPGDGGGQQDTGAADTGAADTGAG